MPALAANDRRRRKKIYVYLDGNNQPDWSALTPENRQALGVTDTGITPPEPEPDRTIQPEVIGMLLSTMIGIEAAIVAPRFGVSAERAREIVTPLEPVAAGICASGARVATKYGGALGRWQDEIVLATLIVTWQTSVFAGLRAEQARQTPPVAPPPPPVDKHESVVKETEPAPPPNALFEAAEVIDIGATSARKAQA
jgi:hypothetical protein